jgi:diaminopimelate epimerase
LRLNRTLALRGGKTALHSVDTGVPHAVMYVPDADQAMVQSVGAEVRGHRHFAPRGTNVNFVQLLGRNAIRVRTYERGVEGETHRRDGLRPDFRRTAWLDFPGAGASAGRGLAGGEF